tara:strand:+ start:261 stop:557 length:297 start_codon:yes stop_codon:yes gene_type:complete
LKLSEEDFDFIQSSCLKKSLIKSKAVKMAQLKEIIEKVSDWRTLMVFDQNYESGENDTLFVKMGSIEGICNIMESVFKAIMEDEGLAKFYKDKNIKEI